MFRTVIDSKNGKVWANHPLDQRMILVADIEENADDYLNWSQMMGKIRTAPIENGDVYWGWVKMITAINNAAESGNELALKKVEKMFDFEAKPAYTIKSDRGNPTDL